MLITDILIKKGLYLIEDFVFQSEKGTGSKNCGGTGGNADVPTKGVYNGSLAKLTH